MEIWPVVHNKSPIKVSNDLKSLLIHFTVNCLIEKPEAVTPYAKEYFDNLLAETKLQEEKEEEILTLEEEESLPERSISDSHVDYVRGRKQVIYSEPYNPEEDDDDEEDVIYDKTPEQREILMNVAQKCFLFKSLGEVQLNRIIDVMFPKEVVPGDTVIKQYDDGDNFYIIEYGLYEVLIAEDPDSEPVHVFTYENSGNFGELALMYNMPRAATIKALTEGRLWAMDRQTFRRIVLKTAFKKRRMYEGLIAKVPMLQELTPYERMNVADALVPKSFPAGTVIIKQHDVADGMYFVEKGTVVCSIYNPETRATIEIRRVSEGGYFGELALITHNLRAATVTAASDVELAFLDVEAFERLLGPCFEIMERNIEGYKLQLEKLGSTIRH